MRIERKRRRRIAALESDRRPQSPPPEYPPLVGARAPGVRQRRHLRPHELDWNERVRQSLEARRGLSPGATVWRT